MYSRYKRQNTIETHNNQETFLIIMRSSEQRRISSVDKTCEILKYLQNSGTSTISELSDITGLSPGTVHTHLATLKDHGFVSQRRNHYSLGMQLVSLGKRFRNHSKLYQASKKEIDKVATETGECVHLLVENKGESVFLYEAYGDNAVGRKFHAQSQEVPSNHMHCYAAGKAILAHLSHEKLDRAFETIKFNSLTSETITNRQKLEQKLKEVKSQGYAVNDEEEIQGIRAVGAPILHEGEPIGGVSISGPQNRLSDETLHSELSERVVTLSRIIELNYRTGELSL